MTEARRRPLRSVPLRLFLTTAIAALLGGCGGGSGGSNDGTFVTREGIVVTGIADDGTPTSPIAGGTCSAVDANGVVLDAATTEADGSYLLLVNPGLQVSILCRDAGQSRLGVRTFVSTVGLSAGGALGGQDVLPSTTVLARIVEQEAADDPSLDSGARLAALRASIVPTGSETAPANADLQLLADATTSVYDLFRDAGVDVDLDDVLTDLFDDSDLDFFRDDADTAAAVEARVAELQSAAGRTLAQAVLATHPTLDLTIVNVGGGRSKLREVARFATVLAAARDAGTERSTLMISPGDVLEPGLVLAADLENQDPFLDSLAIDLLGLDVLGVGVTDLELGPPVYGIFLDRIEGDAVTLLTDIDPTLESLAFAPITGNAAAVTLVLERRQRSIGFVSATPEDIDDLASTRSLLTFSGDARIARIQAGIDGTLAAGARIVVLLASVRDEASLATLVAGLRDVDVVVTLPGVPAVGGDDVAAAPVTLTSVVDLNGVAVPVVPGVGDYAGVVNADLRIDPLGRVDGAPVGTVRRVAGADAAVPTDEDPTLREQVIVPLEAAIADLAANDAARSDVVLDTTAANLRVDDTNWGDVVADALLFTSRSQGVNFQSLAANAALVDAGSLIDVGEIPAGTIDRARVYDLVANGQLVGVLQRVAPADLKRLLEFAFANRGTERFIQIAGLVIEHDPNATAQVLDADGNVIVAGDRVRRVSINGDNALIADGAVVEGAPALAIAVTEQVRDQFPLGGLDIVNIGVSLGQALDGFLRVTLNGSVSSELYPVGGNNRILVAEGS